MTPDLEKSFKAKLRNIAREVDRDPANLWQSVVLERFLVRLGQSPYRHHFVLKGGVLLAKYMPIGRETQDLDFLGVATPNDQEYLKKTFGEIADIALSDGFLFKDIGIAELAHPHMAYAGVEVSMTAYFGRTRFPVAIDIGVGDLSYDALKAVIPSVFAHRQTPFSLPLTFSDREISLLQSHWTGYRAKLQAEELKRLPDDLWRIVTTLNEKIGSIIQ